MPSVRRHTWVLLGGIVAFMLATAFINSWVNPLRVIPSPWSDPSFEPYRDISSQIRTGKAGLVRSHDQVDVAFLGSSRVENGFDPEMQEWKNREVLNLGCSGGYIYETRGIADYLLERNSPSILFCGIDPGDLSRPMDSRDKSDFYASPFARNGDTIDRELRYLLGVSSLENSLETINRRAKDRRSPYTPRGLRGVDEGIDQGSQLGFIRRQLIGNAFGQEGTTANTKIVPDKIEALRDLMIKARTSGARLIIFFHPQHAIMLASLEDQDDPPVFFANERAVLIDLVDQVNREESAGPPVELWDFFDFHPINCEALPLGDTSRMTFWDDLGHFSVPVGNAMQARLMGWPVELEGAEDYGTPLSKETLPQREAEVREGYRAYLEGPRRGDVLWKEELINRKSGP